MLHPTDDLFACGYAAPSSTTICDIALIDDLIILGVIAAVTVAASQVSASENESTQNDLLDQQQNNQLRSNYIQQQSNRGRAAASDLASRHRGAVPMHSATEAMDPWAQKLAIQNNVDLGRQANARQADATRTQGYIQAGSTIAQGIAGQALRSPSGSGFVAGAGYEGTGANIGDRAGGYDLSAPSSSITPVQTAPLHMTDPGGGYQLQASDYATLGGAAPYSDSPFADDPYGTAPQYNNPNRYRFGI